MSKSITVSIKFGAIAYNVPETEIKQRTDELIKKIGSLIIDKCDYEELKDSVKIEISPG